MKPAMVNTLVLVLLSAAMALANSGSELVAPSGGGGEILEQLNSTGCGGQSQFISLDVSSCNGATSCYVFEESTMDFSITFKSEFDIRTLTISAYARLIRTGESSQLGFRHYQTYYGGNNRTNMATTFMKFPKSTMEFEEYEVEFSIDTENGREICTTYKFTVVDYSKELVGDALGETCEAIGLPCKFSNSICDSAMKCTCGPEHVANSAGECKTASSWQCGSDDNCDDFAECGTVIGGKACQCTDGFWLDTKKCVRNDGKQIGDNCTYAFHPCDFARSNCNSNQKCDCENFAIASDDGTVCLARLNTVCEMDSDCVTGASCVNPDENGKRCVCNAGYVVEDSRCAFSNPGTTVNGTCSKPGYGCAFNNSLCLDSKSCGCIDNYVSNGVECQLPSGAACQNSKDCGVNSYCTGEAEGKQICTCQENYAPNTLGICMQMQGIGIGQTCAEAGFMCNFPNSICDNSLKCACNTDNSMQQNNQCRIRAGKICQRNSDCVADATCDNVGDNNNGVCRCATAFVQETDGSCSSSSVLGYSSALMVMAALVAYFSEKQY